MNKKQDLAKLKNISAKYNLKTFALYTYDLSKQPKSKAVRFVYLLKGRADDKGIIQEFNGKFLAPGCFIIPIKKDKEMREIFAYWKISFKRKLFLTH